MSAKPNFFRIGLFIIIGLAILAGGLISFGAGQFFKKRIYMETYVNSSVQGVDQGTPVKFRGVPIGAVSAITFSFNEYGASSEVDRYNYIVILMEIDKEMFPGMFDENLTALIDKNIKQGMRARIEPLGITGMNYIDINYVKDPAEFPPLEVNWTPHNYYIPSAPGQIASILDSVNTMMSDMKKLNMEDLAKNLNEIMAKLNQAITDAELDKVSTGLQALIADFQKTVADAKIAELSANIQKAIADAKLGEVSADARRLLQGLEKSNAELQKVLKNIEPASKINAAQIKAVVSNLADTTANLEAFSSSIKQRPSSLLWGSPPKPKPESTPTPKPTPRRR